MSKTARARKLKLKTRLDMPKYSFRVIKFFRYGASRGVAAPPNVKT